MNTNQSAYTVEVDTQEQYNLIPNSTYFRDNYLCVTLYKDAEGNIVNPYIDESGSTFATIPILRADFIAMLDNPDPTGYTEGFYLIYDATASATRGAKADYGILVQYFKGSAFNSWNRASLNGTGLFYNPDFQFIGNYQAVQDFTGIPAGALRGIWNESLSPIAVGEMVIWDGYHYQKITDLEPLNINPAVNSDFQLMGKGTFIDSGYYNQGYIMEQDMVIYDIVNDSIIKRCDKRGNEIFNSEYFQWGNNSKTGNIDTQNSTFDIIDDNGFEFKSNKALGSVTVTATENNLGKTVGTVFSGDKIIIIDRESNVKKLNNCEIKVWKNMTLDPAGTYDVLTNNSINSNFSATTNLNSYAEGDIVLDFDTIAAYYAGIIYLNDSTPPIVTPAPYSISGLYHFPAKGIIRFKPTNTIVTFIHGTGSPIYPRCQGGVNAVVDGTKGDWIEFRKDADGFIYQHNIGTY